MRLRIEHRTVYRYEPAVRLVVQSLRLRPSGFDGQRVIEWRIEAGEHSIDAGYVDGAGNRVNMLTAHGPLETLEVVSAGVVDVADRAGVVRGLREIVHPLVWLRAGPLTGPATAIEELARSAVPNPGADRLEQGHALAYAVAQAVRYEPGASHAGTTAAEALATGVGVCQDHAHVLVAAARSLDIPARYVTGYLHDGNGSIGGDATHAWAELHLGVYGWIGFDPANHQCPTQDYVRLACGVDAIDAAPFRGAAIGAARETLSLDVQVQPAQQ
jgi:transglutaminase-like putative cysteine protease